MSFLVVVFYHIASLFYFSLLLLFLFYFVVSFGPWPKPNWGPILTHLCRSICPHDWPKIKGPRSPLMKGLLSLFPMHGYLPPTWAVDGQNSSCHSRNSHAWTQRLEDLPTCLARPGPPMKFVVHSGLHCQLHLRRPSSRLSLRRPVVTINSSWPCLPSASPFSALPRTLTCRLSINLCTPLLPKIARLLSPYAKITAHMAQLPFPSCKSRRQQPKVPLQQSCMATYTEWSPSPHPTAAQHATCICHFVRANYRLSQLAPQPHSSQLHPQTKS